MELGVGAEVGAGDDEGLAVIATETGETVGVRFGDTLVAGDFDGVTEGAVVRAPIGACVIILACNEASVEIDGDIEVTFVTRDGDMIFFDVTSDVTMSLGDTCGDICLLFWI